MKLPIEKIMNYILKGTVLLLPFFFFPVSTSFVNFNKVSLVIFIALVLLFLLAIKIVKEGRVPKLFQKKGLDYLVLAYFSGHLLFTIFSSNPLISFFGEYGEWFPSFISTAAVTIIYFVSKVSLEKKDIKQVLMFLSFGISISSLLSIVLFYFKDSLGSIYLTDSTFGPGREAAVFAILGAVLGVYFILREDIKSILKSIQIAAFLLNVFIIFLVGSFEGFIILIIALVGLYLITSPHERQKYENKFVLFFVAPIFLLLISLVPSIREGFLLNKEFISNQDLGPVYSFLLTKKATVDSLIVGRGLGTELETFTRNKPIEYNNSDNSDKILLRYYSDAFEIVSTIGILGFAVYLGVILLGAKTAIYAVEDSEHNEKFFIGILLLLIAVSSFFFSTGILLVFILFTFLSLIEVGQKEYKEIAKPTAIIIGLFLILVALFGVYGYGRVYLAEMNYKKALEALKQDKGDETFEILRSIKKLNPYRSEYRKSLSQIELAIVSLIVEQGSLDEAAQQDVEVLIADVTDNVKGNTEKLNPNSTIEWENRGEAYLVLSNFISGTEDFVIDAYNKAIELDPNNPHLRDRIGNIYLRFDNREDALRAFNDAVTLKPEIFSARLSRAALLLDQGKRDDAKVDLQFIVDNADTSSEIYTSSKTLLESL